MPLSDLIPESTASVLSLLLSLFVYLAIFILPLLGLAGLIHEILSVPLRRRERARFFLDLVDAILAQGRPLESSLVSLAACRDAGPGVRFHLLAAHLENGDRFGVALEKVPRFLPPQITAILRAGERLGDLRRVLPACREILREPGAGAGSALHYLIVVLLVFSPVAIGAMALVGSRVHWVREVLLPMSPESEPAFLKFLVEYAPSLVWVQCGILGVLLLGLIFYIGGPRLTGWLQFGMFPIADWMAWRIPWKRMRLQRTFSAMLAVLLDGGVPEAEAVQIAGDSTANAIGRRRAQRVIAALQQGVKLSEAVPAFDNHGEFRWRLTNAAPAREGFLTALQGWHEALDARAFQQEEAAAHLISSSLVVVNGLIVAAVAAALFGSLIMVMEHAIW